MLVVAVELRPVEPALLPEARFDAERPGPRPLRPVQEERLLQLLREPRSFR